MGTIDTDQLGLSRSWAASGNPTGDASLIAPDPQPGPWEIDVMQGATTDGTEFSHDFDYAYTVGK